MDESGRLGEWLRTLTEIEAAVDAALRGIAVPEEVAGSEPPVIGEEVLDRIAERFAEHERHLHAAQTQVDALSQELRDLADAFGSLAGQKIPRAA
jgi:hypothetical protein